MPTTTFSITADADDGSGYWEDTAWPPTGGTFNTDDGASMFATRWVSATYVSEVAVMRFDTSSLTSGAVVSAATLKLYCEAAINANGYSVEGDYYDFGGEPTVAADWALTPSGTSIFTGIPTTSWTTSAVNNVTLTDLSGINTTGYTGIRLIMVGAGTPTGQNFVQWATAESANQEPRLDVTYSAPAVTNEAALRTSRTPIVWRT